MSLYFLRGLSYVCRHHRTGTGTGTAGGRWYRDRDRRGVVRWRSLTAVRGNWADGVVEIDVIRYGRVGVRARGLSHERTWHVCVTRGARLMVIGPAPCACGVARDAQAWWKS